MHPGLSYVITDGEGVMIAHGSCSYNDLLSKCRVVAEIGATIMFGPYDGTGE